MHAARLTEVDRFTTGLTRRALRADRPSVARKPASLARGWFNGCGTNDPRTDPEEALLVHRTLPRPPSGQVDGWRGLGVGARDDRDGYVRGLIR